MAEILVLVATIWAGIVFTGPDDAVQPARPSYVSCEGATLLHRNLSSTRTYGSENQVYILESGQPCQF
jgi:hypothetical protein